MPEPHGDVSFPGVEGRVVDCQYTASHGLSPGVAVLRCLPGDSLPAALGTLVITDGFGTVTLRDCRLERMEFLQDDSGQTWELALSDRRWRWREQGEIYGCYNQLDPHAKLIPWTVRSPTELAELCLKAMGESNYRVVLPPGLSKDDFGAGHAEDWLQQGENFPATGTNPPVDWYADVPAQALAAVADQYGAVVVYDPVTDSVYVGPPGEGAQLPDGSIARQSPSLTVPELPDGVAVVGSPTRYQLRILLEAVGREYDDSYRPIDELSYAPLGADGKPTWAKSPVPFVFAVPEGDTTPGAVRGTDRLTRVQALDLANDSVWRTYRVAGRDIWGDAKILVPGFGRLKRRHQLVLLDTQVEQIRPQAGDKDVRTKDPDETLMTYLYNGYSRDRPAECYGSIALDCFQDLNLYFTPTTKNSPAGSKVPIPFSIDKDYQLVVFGRPVYHRGETSGVIEEPDPLVLQTAVHVRAEDTNQLLRLEAIQRFGQSTGSNLIVRRHPDIQANIYGVYNDASELLETKNLEQIGRAHV